MNMISAAGAVAALVGAAADGYIDTKYAFNKDGTQRTVLGMSPGIFVGVAAAALGLFGLGGSYSGLFVTAGVGVLAGEAMRYAANQTAHSMMQQQQQQQGTQGLSGWQLPLFAGNNNGFFGYAAAPRIASTWEFNSALDRLEGLRRAA